MKTFDIAVIGAGPAGIMAAIRASQLKKDVVLIERNDSIGKKIMLTGRGRCNVTNAASIDTFIEKFDGQGEFLRTAFYKFSNQDLIDFLESKGAALKTEDNGRLFPKSDTAASIVDALRACLKENKVDIVYNRRILQIAKENNIFTLDFKQNNTESIKAKKVILATGGVSYKETGSTGDGFSIAKEFGHKIIPLTPALVPLTTKEQWVKDLQGLSLRDIRLIFKYNKNKIVSQTGEIMFTHYGASGPLIIDLSSQIALALGKYKEIALFIDLKPGLTCQKLERILLNEFTSKGIAKIKNIMKNLLPQRLAAAIVVLSGLSPEKPANQISQKERGIIIKLLKELPLTVNGTLPIDDAMVTAGGISTKEINPRTMESKIAAGLYFAGEIVDACAQSGGFNLQQAFSTGYLAGEAASDA